MISCSAFFSPKQPDEADIESGFRYDISKAAADGFSSSSLVIDHNGNIYIGSGGGELFSISKTGNMNWSFYTDGPVRTAPLIDADGNEKMALSNRQQCHFFTGSR